MSNENIAITGNKVDALAAYFNSLISTTPVKAKKLTTKQAYDLYLESDRVSYTDEGNVWVFDGTHYRVTNYFANNNRSKL